MIVDNLIFEIQFLKVTQLLFEKPNEQNNNIVKSWAKKLNMTYDELHEIWDKAKKDVGSETDYNAIVGRFKKMITSLKGVTKKQLKDGGKATFNYKVRTQQTKEELLDDEPPPKKANKAFVKKTKAKLSMINKQMKALKQKPKNTPLQKKKINDKLKLLKTKKTELKDTIK